MTVYYKPPLTIDQQVDYIELNKRVVYNKISKDQAKEILKTYGYINVITPFKYMFAKRDENGVTVKMNGRHVYERNVDFSEYYDAFMRERSVYPTIYKNISDFESKFNACIAYECIHTYRLDNSDRFADFVAFLQSNIISNYQDRKKDHMLKSVLKFPEKIDDYGSIYIFFDRLSLNELVTIYRNISSDSRESVFSKMLKMNATIGYTRLDAFDKMLPKLVQIRNYVFHENSLTVLKRYYDIRTKGFRNKSNRQSYTRLINKLSV